jgi:hypothetical protein
MHTLKRQALNLYLALQNHKRTVRRFSPEYNRIDYLAQLAYARYVRRCGREYHYE